MNKEKAKKMAILQQRIERIKQAEHQQRADLHRRYQGLTVYKAGQHITGLLRRGKFKQLAHLTIKRRDLENQYHREMNHMM